MVDAYHVGGEAVAASIGEFYRDRNVLVTGGTGFLGKVLVEKLLRSCEHIGTIYLIIRPKKGQAVQERLTDLLSQEVFQRLHEERPMARNKVVAIEGDLREQNFDLNERDRALLVNTVSVVIHSAATIKFDEKMKEAVNMNVGATKHMIDLAKSMPDLKAFVYISTAYSNCDRLLIEEKYYPLNAPDKFWHDLITVANKMDEKELDALSPSLIGKLPNNYTFTKKVAESLVYDYKDDIPLVIYRPSIVANAYYEPYPGWVDNINGAVGLIIGHYTGIIRLHLSTVDTKNDWIGVDFAVNGVIAAAWKRQQMPTGGCPVYNCAVGKYGPTFRELSPFLNYVHYNYPTEKTVWKPKLNMTTNFFWFQLNFILFNVIPAAILDVVLKAKGIKFSAVKACRKILTVCRILRYFTLTNFDIRHDNVIELYESLTPEDKKTFNFDIVSTSALVRDLLLNGALGLKKYILKDDMSEEAMEKLRKRTKYYDWADVAVRVAFYIVVTIIAWNILEWYFLGN